MESTGSVLDKVMLDVLLTVLYSTLTISGGLFLAHVVLVLWYRLWMGSRGLSVRRLLSVQLHETGAWLKVGWWHVDLLRKARRGSGRKVLAVHGYTQNPSNWRGLRLQLAGQGRDLHAVFLGFAWPWRRVEGYARPLERALERLVERAEQADVVVHSMGGLVLREVLSRREDLRQAVGSVVTLGTPHQGTAAARLGLFHPTAQLRYGASWLKDLPVLTELLPADRVTTIGTSGDMIVYPVTSTRQPNARHVEFDHVGHAGLLTDVRVLRAAIEALTPAPI